MAKRRYTKEFREVAVERLRGCENIVALAKELRVSRRQLYRWRDELDPEIPRMGGPPGQNARASTLRKCQLIISLERRYRVVRSARRSKRTANRSRRTGTINAVVTSSRASFRL